MKAFSEFFRVASPDPEGIVPYPHRRRYRTDGGAVTGIPRTPNPQIAPRSRPVGASFLLQQTDDHALPPFFCNEKRPNCISEEMSLAFTRASQVHNLMQLMVSCIWFFTGLNPASDFVVVV